jgi:transposase-like protein
VRLEQGQETVGTTLSKSTVSRVTQQLQQDFETWRRRDLSELSIIHVFVDFLDGQYHAVRQGTDEKEGVLSAYALLDDGRPVLLHLDLGPREWYDAWLSFLQDLTARGLKDPLLVVIDGAPGLVKLVKRVWPHAFRQRCPVQRMRNILAKVSRLMRDKMKTLVQQVFPAPTHALAIKRGRALIARFADRYSAAMACLEQDLEECVTYLRFSRGAPSPDPDDQPARAPQRRRPTSDEGHPAIPDGALAFELALCVPHRGVEDVARRPDDARHRQPAAATARHDHAGDEGRGGVMRGGGY